MSKKFFNFLFLFISCLSFFIFCNVASAEEVATQSEVVASAEEVATQSEVDASAGSVAKFENQTRPL